MDKCVCKTRLFYYSIETAEKLKNRKFLFSGELVQAPCVPSHFLRGPRGSSSKQGGVEKIAEKWCPQHMVVV